jgi:FAD:protein FMN transferase
MDAKTWNLLRRAAACVPLAVAATQISVSAETPATRSDQQANTWTFHYENVLGTSLELKVRASSASRARLAEAAALAELDRQDAVLSAWRHDSEFSRWAATRFEAVQVSPELFQVLSAFDSWRNQTSGALDPAFATAARLWQQALAEHRVPTDAEVAQAREAIAQPHWQLDSEHRTATRLTDVPLALATFTKSYISSQAADAAIRAGATGITLNIGGDLVVRGSMQQVVDIADPLASAENDLPFDRVSVRDRAIATSGSYRRNIEQATASLIPSTKSTLSHIVDPRTAEPVSHILSSTVIARDAETAGALATAFSILTPEESANLAASHPGVDYLIITAEGRRLQSPGWSDYQLPGLHTVAYAPPAPKPGAKPAAKPAAPAVWDQAFELNINLEVARIDNYRVHSPYVAVWIEDANHFPVRTLALWFQKPRWLPELKGWYRDDQVRYSKEGNDITRTVSSATRPAGQYTIKWDGKDNQGNFVKPGKYTVFVEAAREHGTYQIKSQEMDFSGQPQQATMAPGTELGAVTLDYRKR